MTSTSKKLKKGTFSLSILSTSHQKHLCLEPFGFAFSEEKQNTAIFFRKDVMIKERAPVFGTEREIKTRNHQFLEKLLKTKQYLYAQDNIFYHGEN